MITLEQLFSIMPALKKDKAKAEEYLPYLNAAMNEAQINTIDRAASFLAQLAHESVELKYFEEIASGAAYEGRKDLGNIHPGDGKRYKGRGPIQLTGRANYQAAGKALGLPLETDPELVAYPEIGFRVAGWYWTTHRLNSLADAKDFDAITHKINGGYNGKKSRDKYYQTALKVLGA